jgi:hypothetical protein
MSSQNLISISVRQQPVIDRLHETMMQALAYAHAIADNAIDAGDHIPPELTASFTADCNRILYALEQATR